MLINTVCVPDLSFCFQNEVCTEKWNIADLRFYYFIPLIYDFNVVRLWVSERHSAAICRVDTGLHCVSANSQCGCYWPCVACTAKRTGSAAVR